MSLVIDFVVPNLEILPNPRTQKMSNILMILSPEKKDYRAFIPFPLNCQNYLFHPFRCIFSHAASYNVKGNRIVKEKGTATEQKWMFTIINYHDKGNKTFKHDNRAWATIISLVMLRGSSPGLSRAKRVPQRLRGNAVARLRKTAVPHWARRSLRLRDLINN